MTDNTAGAPWGASAADWLHFQGLGLTADLLPVVSQPDAKVSRLSKMRDLGKTPSRFNSDGDAVGIPKWTQLKATDGQVGRWSQDSRLGICLQTRAVRAIDIDIDDPVEAAKVLELLEMGLPSLPRRFRAGAGKCLLAFRMPGEFAKRIIRTPHGIIEFLATGQQFVAVGTHPKGMRYEWVDADGVIGLPAEIPELTPSEFEVAWQALADTFGTDEGSVTVRNGLVPTKVRLASDLTDPTVAWLEAAGWVLEYERDGKVNVRCPWEDQHTTDSGPSATTWFPAGVGGFQQGHFRCLHAHCATRSDGDFLEAVGYVADDFDVVDTVANAKAAGVAIEVPLPAFARNRAGQVLATFGNAVMAVQRPDICGLHVGFDAFRGEVMVSGEGEAWRKVNDNDYSRVRTTLERKGYLPPSKESVRDAMHLVAEERTFDSAQQWLDGLVWDGVPRVDRFWAQHFGIEDSDYTRAVARYTWSALAGRVITPGEKCDMVPVLIGLQGAGKTTAIEALCPLPEAFVEINLEKRDEDIARSLRGKLVGEIAELRGLQTRDGEAIKAWISRRTEEWVPKYKENAFRFERRLLLFGTGNREGFLDDETGERRWLPMVVGQVDVAAVAAVRDQLWAEGAGRYRANGVEWQDAYRLGREVHKRFKVGDPWLELVQDWLARDEMDQADGAGRGARPVRLLDVLVSAIGMKPERISRREELRVARVLTLLGYERRATRVDGGWGKRWFRRADSDFAENNPFSDLA
jgi:hypothetical protein